MANDEESTQPIDIEALRSSLPSKTPRAGPDDTFATDEHTAIEVGVPGADPVEDRPFDEPYPSDGPFGVAAPASSVTRIDASPVASLPGTVPAHELVQALVAVMGARSERLDRLVGDAGDGDDTLGPGLDTLANSLSTQIRDKVDALAAGVGTYFNTAGEAGPDAASLIASVNANAQVIANKITISQTGSNTLKEFKASLVVANFH